jgi:hypothetical protein
MGFAVHSKAVSLPGPAALLADVTLGGARRGECDICSNGMMHNRFQMEHTVALALYLAAAVCILIPLAETIPYATAAVELALGDMASCSLIGRTGRPKANLQMESADPRSTDGALRPHVPLRTASGRARRHPYLLGAQSSSYEHERRISPPLLYVRSPLL